MVIAGQTALHFAVVNDNLGLVKYLVKKGADVNQEASGKFFLPEDNKIYESERFSSNFEGKITKLLLMGHK